MKGGQVHYTHAAVKASDDVGQSLAVQLTFCKVSFYVHCKANQRIDDYAE